MASLHGDPSPIDARTFGTATGFNATHDFPLSEQLYREAWQSLVVVTERFVSYPRRGKGNGHGYGYGLGHNRGLGDGHGDIPVDNPDDQVSEKPKQRGIPGYDSEVTYVAEQSDPSQGLYVFKMIVPDLEVAEQWLAIDGGAAIKKQVELGALNLEATMIGTEMTYRAIHYLNPEVTREMVAARILEKLSGTGIFVDFEGILKGNLSDRIGEQVNFVHRD